MKCPFCLQPMTSGLLRSRLGTAVFRPDEASDSWLPAPLDILTRSFRDETVVVGTFAGRAAYHCPTCDSLAVPPLPPSHHPLVDN